MNSQSVYDEKRKGKIVTYFITKDMANKLDKIVSLESDKHGIKSRNDLIIRILSHFMGSYFYKDDKFARALAKSQIEEWRGSNKKSD
ncbi:MAG: hypothetical protein ACHQXG_06805 [Nitrososphaerales archaeon]